MRPTLEWHKSGRSYYAYIGRLRLQVRPLPVTLMRQQRMWIVADVFGDQFACREEFDYMPDAQAAAEKVARKYIRDLKRWAEPKARCAVPKRAEVRERTFAPALSKPWGRS